MVAPPVTESHPGVYAEIVLIDDPVAVEAEQVVRRRADLDQLHHGRGDQKPLLRMQTRKAAW